MTINPQELKYAELPRVRFGGYKRQEVERLLDEVAGDLEKANHEREDLVERLSQRAAEASKQHELEGLLRSTLVSAERAAQDLKEQARRESDLIVQEAHAEARQITRASLAEKQKIEGEIRQIRAMLRSALEALEDWPTSEPREEQPAVQQVSPEEPTDDGIRTIAG